VPENSTLKVCSRRVIHSSARIFTSRIDVQDLVASLGDSVDSNDVLPSRPETPSAERSESVRVFVTCERT
jgi:hypothetical protein